MHSIGKTLKELREERGYQLLDVYKKTKIDLSLLSRFENGKRLPTKKQVALLASYYKCDKNKILINLLSDKVLYEIKDEKFQMEALQVAEEIISYGKPQSLFPEFEVKKQVNLESRRYIGNKAKLTEWIIGTISQEAKNVHSVIDVFAGTGSVSKSLFNNFDTVYINDILYSNNIIYKAFFESGKWDLKKLSAILETWNELNPDRVTDNYFSKNYGNKFYEYGTSKIIGFVREDIESMKENLTIKEYNILLATLIYSIDKVANTVGHFDAYIKKPIKQRKLVFNLINPQGFSGAKIFREDANTLVKKLKADVAYIDPPYNSRQYGRFYHLYENLVKWNKPKLFGVALKPEPENKSLYCTVAAKEVFKDLIENLNVKYIAVSYNNTYNSKSGSSENKMKLETIQSILNQKGKTKTFECQHRHFNAGKTEFNDHKELLFITKVNGK